jgi:TatD DNase family protein
VSATPGTAADGPVLVDSHCHLGDPRFAPDREATIARAAAAGVRAIVCVGATGSMATNEAAVALVRREDPEIVAAVGIHPHDVAGATDADYARLRGLCAAPGVVAVGETGLDFHYLHSPAAAQREHLRRTVRLAREVGRPLVVHCREAFAETAAILRDEDAGATGGVIHCFTGGPDDARVFLDLGFHLSFSGVITFRNAGPVREAAAMAPAERLLVETDGPYLAPVPHRGRRNEPAFVGHVVETLASLRGATPGEMGRRTAANAARLFGLRTVRAAA